MKYRVYRKKRNGKPDRTYTARFSGRGGSFERGLGVSTRDAADAKARKMLARYEREEVGLAEQDRREAERNRPVSELLQSFIARKFTEGLSDGYIRKLRERLSGLFDEMGIEHLGEFSTSCFDDWLVMAQESGRSQTTRRHYADALRVFLTDLNRRGLIGRSYVDQLPRPSRGKLPVRVQRPFTEQELARLGGVDVFWGPVYLFMAYTGVRKGEMEQLRVDDLILEGSKPMLRVRAEVGKSGRHDSVPLNMGDALVAAGMLRRWAIESGRKRLLPTRRMNPRKFDMHLAAANVSKLDDEGRFVSLHSFRKTLADMCIRYGVTPAVAQRLLRHSDIRLTMQVYARAGIDQTFGESSQIPGLGGSCPLSRPRDDTPESNTTRHTETITDGEYAGNRLSQPATGVSRLRQSETQSDGYIQKWSRGESNPRAETAGTVHLRV